MDKLLVSVVIPTFNRSHLLLRAIDSVLSQSYKNVEIIIVDDFSSDHTVEMVKHFFKERQFEKFKLIENEKNYGVSYSRNQAIKESGGDYIAFLDSDDEWLERKLERQMDFFKINSQVALVHGEEIWIRNGVRVNQKKIHQKFGGQIFLKCLPLCIISPSAALVRKDILQEFDFFDEQYIVCEDYDLWLKITSKYEVGFISDPIIKKYGGHEDQLSNKFFAMDFYRIKSMFRIYEDYNLSKENKSKVAQEIIKKSEVLLNGYIKHNNMENYDLILKIKEEVL